MAEQRGAAAAPPEGRDQAGDLTAAERVGPAARLGEHAARAGAPGKKFPPPAHARIYVNLFKVWPRYQIAARGRGK
jgi:hypothetical protein